MFVRNTYLIAAIVLFANLGNAQDTTKQNIINQSPNNSIEQAYIDTLTKYPLLEVRTTPTLTGEIGVVTSAGEACYFMDGFFVARYYMADLFPVENTKFYIYSLPDFVVSIKGIPRSVWGLKRVDSLPSNIKGYTAQWLNNPNLYNIDEVKIVGFSENGKLKIGYKGKVVSIKKGEKWQIKIKPYNNPNEKGLKPIKIVITYYADIIFKLR